MLNRLQIINSKKINSEFKRKALEINALDTKRYNALFDEHYDMNTLEGTSLDETPDINHQRLFCKRSSAPQTGRFRYNDVLNEIEAETKIKPNFSLSPDIQLALLAKWNEIKQLLPCKAIFDIKADRIFNPDIDETTLALLLTYPQQVHSILNHAPILFEHLLFELQENQQYILLNDSVSIKLTLIGCGIKEIVRLRKEIEMMSFIEANLKQVPFEECAAPATRKYFLENLYNALIDHGYSTDLIFQFKQSLIKEFKDLLDESHFSNQSYVTYGK